MKRIRVFVIEDGERITRFLARYLEQLGWLTESGDGSEFFRIDIFRPDILFLDWELPSGKALSIIQELKIRKPLLPLLVATRSKDEDHEVDCLMAGADGFLRMPFTQKVMKAHVLTQLRRVSLQPADFDDGHLRISFSERKLFIDGRNIPLTPLEWQLLRYLAGSSEAVHRQTLLTSIWGDHTPTVDALEKAVSRLRAAIEPNPRRPSYVVSVRGVGYRFLTKVSGS